MNWYVNSFGQCAPWSYVLACGQSLLVAMLIERAAYLFAGGAINAEMFLEQVRKLALANNVDRALKLTAAAGERPIARVCRAGLLALGQGPFAVQSALDQAIALEMPRIFKRLPSIPVVAAALAAFGIVGSKLLGANSVAFGGDGPLPFGLAMELAPALIGATSCVIGLLGWLWMSRAAKGIVDGLMKARRVLGDLGHGGMGPGG